MLLSSTYINTELIRLDGGIRGSPAEDREG